MAFTSPTSLWVYNSLALGLYILRLSVRKWKRQDFTNGDYWTVSATVWIIIRLGISHTTLKYGNNLALSDQQREEMPFTDREIHYLVLNSKLNLFFRVVLLSLLWSLKMVVLDLITFLFRRHHYEHVIRWGFYTVFLITYLVPFVLIFVECRPFHLYWQLQPNPGKCVRGTWWLFSYEAGNIATDAMLIVPPFTIIFQAKITLAKRLQLSALFSLGIFLVVVSAVRIVQGTGSTQLQRNRTLWASLETLAASIVATVPALYSMIRQRKSSVSYSSEPSESNNSNRRSAAAASQNRRTTAAGMPGRFSYVSNAWVELGEPSHRGRRDGNEPDGEGDSMKGILVETWIDRRVSDRSP